VKVVELEAAVKASMDEWGQILLYQKPLSTLSESLHQTPDLAVTRIQKRLQHKPSSVLPVEVVLHEPPFEMLNVQLLLSSNDLLTIVMEDVCYVAQQARSFFEKINNLCALDSEYLSVIPGLYSNEPRQFHVTVPCHSKISRNRVCSGPATIVFRFDELTCQTHLDERIKQNRQEYHRITDHLSQQPLTNFCKSVTRVERVVLDLSKFSTSEALACGVSLFYEMLRLISCEVKSYRPSCLFFTSCIEILGQKFIERNPSQSKNILELIMTQPSLSDMLSSLFSPNIDPAQFIHMYSYVLKLADKEGCNIAFSILSKVTYYCLCLQIEFLSVKLCIRCVAVYCSLYIHLRML
jgi:hypothetical protein